MSPAKTPRWNSDWACSASPRVAWRPAARAPRRTCAQCGRDRCPAHPDAAPAPPWVVEAALVVRSPAALFAPSPRYREDPHPPPCPAPCPSPMDTSSRGSTRRFWARPPRGATAGPDAGRGHPPYPPRVGLPLGVPPTPAPGCWRVVAAAPAFPQPPQGGRFDSPARSQVPCVASVATMIAVQARIQRRSL